MEKSNISLFQDKAIRKIWFQDEWWFSVVDVIAALTDSADAGAYWRKFKQRLNEEGSEVVTFCHGLKLVAPDGKKYETDCANTEGIFRIIQSVPSPKAEPFKLWLAKVGYERIAEIQDPSQGVDRARRLWKRYGRSDKWIQQRMLGQETRNKLTDYWKGHGVREGDEYAILTNIIHQEWAKLSVTDHKKLKGLKTQNLRDHMSEAELIFTALAEMSTRQIAETMTADGMQENKVAGKTGGGIAKKARIELEEKTGKKVVTAKNYLSPPKPIKRLEN